MKEECKDFSGCFVWFCSVGLGLLGFFFEVLDFFFPSDGIFLVGKKKKAVCILSL